MKHWSQARPRRELAAIREAKDPPLEPSRWAIRDAATAATKPAPLTVEKRAESHA